MILGASGLFDLGLGRALTVEVAARRNNDAGDDVYKIIASGIVALTVLGGSFAMLFAFFADELSGLINTSDVIRAELNLAFVIAAPAIVLVVVSSGITGALEAERRFDYSNLTRIVVGFGSIGGSTLVSVFDQSLPAMAIVLLATRLLSTGVGICLLRIAVPVTSWKVKPSARNIGEFVRSARWMTASNLLGPALRYGDRLVLSVLVSAELIAFYVTPYDLVTKVLILPGAVVSVLLPEFASASSDSSTLLRLLRKGVTLTVVSTLPILSIFAVFAHPAIGWWITPNFADSSTRVAQILCVGVFCNAIATLPFALLQGIGRADLVTKAHILELPFYLSALVIAASRSSIAGLAVVWAGRMAVDAMILYSLALWRLRAAR